MLELRGLSVVDRGARVVESLELRVPTGAILGIAGSTAAARTSVLLAIAGHAPERGDANGSVLVDGTPTTSIGLVTREHQLIGSLTAVENVVTSLFARGRVRPRDGRAVERLLSALELPEASWHNLVENLSGGQQQRVALARALVSQPVLLCLDDPVSELDEATGVAVVAQIRAAAARGAAVVVTVQDAEEESLCDRILHL